MEEKYRVEIKPSYEWDEKAILLSISRREVEVFALMTEGFNNKEIATKLKINYQSVKNHIHHFITKLGVKNNNQALVVALHLNLIKVNYQNEFMKTDLDAKGILDELKGNLVKLDEAKDVSAKDKQKFKKMLKEHGIDPEKW